MPLVRITLQFGTLQRIFVDSIWTTVGVQLTSNATPASFTATSSTYFPVYHRLGDEFLDGEMLLVWPKRGFNLHLLDLRRLFGYMTGCSPALAAACNCVNDVE